MNSFQALMVSFLTGMLGATSASASGHDVGNGGNAVVCYRDASRTEVVGIELFDYWEQAQRVTPRQEVDLGPASLGVKEKVRKALARIRPFDPLRARNYERAAETILDHLNLYFSDSVNPTPIGDDTSPLEPAAPCYKVQFAIQIRNPLPGEKKFRINRSLYQHPLMSNDVRAGLILHEVLYREAIANGQTTSDTSRHFNFIISSRELENASLSQYQALLQRLALGFGDCRPRIIDGRIFHVNASDQVTFCAPFMLRYRNFRVSVERGHLEMPDGQLSAVRFAGELVLLHGGRELVSRPTNPHDAYFTVHPDGTLNQYANYTLDFSETDFRLSIEFERQRAALCDTSGGLYQFSPTGKVLGCHLADDVVVVDRGRRFRLRENNQVRVDDSGRLMEFSFEGDAPFRIEGTDRTFPFGGYVKLNSSGNATDGILRPAITRPVNGISTSIREFSDARQGSAATRVYHELTPELNGLRVLYPAGGEAVAEFCRLKGYERFQFGADAPTTELVFVAEDTSFYDLAAGRTVRVNFQEVRLIQGKIRCIGNFRFEF